MRPKSLKECISFCGGGMDIFWNYTLQRDVTVKQFNKHLSTEFHVSIKEPIC